MLEAIKYLDEKFKSVLDKETNDEKDEVKEILQGQGIIHAIVVKNNESICLMKKSNKKMTKFCNF